MRGVVRDTAPQLPQTFETKVEIVARGDWNDLRPRLAMPQFLTAETTMVWLKGTATGLERGDRLLMTLPQPEGVPLEVRILEVTAVEVEFERDRTRVEMRIIPKLLPPSTPPSRQIAFFGGLPPSPAPAAPVPPPLAPLPGPTYVLVRRPLTHSEIIALIVGKAASEPLLRAQMFFFGWALNEFQRHLWWLQRWINFNPVEEFIRIDPPADVTRPTVMARVSAARLDGCPLQDPDHGRLVRRADGPGVVGAGREHKDAITTHRVQARTAQSKRRPSRHGLRSSRVRRRHRDDPDQAELATATPDQRVLSDDKARYVVQGSRRRERRA